MPDQQTPNMEGIETERKQANNGDNTENEDRKINEAGPESKPEVSSSEKPLIVDDMPEHDGITDGLVQVFLKRFLSEDVPFIVKGYKYRAVEKLGEGHTSTRKVLEVTYLDEITGNDGVASFVVKFPGKQVLATDRLCFSKISVEWTILAHL